MLDLTEKPLLVYKEKQIVFFQYIIALLGF
jgi:hypothetical protein